MNSKSITEHGRIGEMQDLVNDCIHGSIANLERTEQLSGVRTRAMAEITIARVQQCIVPNERVDRDANAAPSRAHSIHLTKPTPSPISLPSRPIRAVDIAFLREKARVLFAAVNKIIPVVATFPQDVPSAAMRERVNRIHLLIAELYGSSFLFLKSRYVRWHSLHKKHQVDVRANMFEVLPKLAQ